MVYGIPVLKHDDAVLLSWESTRPDKKSYNGTVQDSENVGAERENVKVR
jgi:hypothetical protein